MSGHVAIVDLEYSLPNFGAFDLANHFMRYCGGSDDPSGKPNYSRFPDRQAQTAFCRTYLEARDQRKPTAAEVDKLLDDLDILSATALSLVACKSLVIDSGCRASALVGYLCCMGGGSRGVLLIWNV